MKTIKLSILTLVLLVGTTLSAANGIGDRDKNEEATTEIAQLLENPNFEFEDETSAQVTLMVNEKGQLVILAVSSDNRRVKDFVESRLNNQKLENSLEIGKRYNLPVVFNSVD